MFAIRIEQDDFIKRPHFNVSFVLAHNKNYVNGTMKKEKVKTQNKKNPHFFLIL